MADIGIVGSGIAGLQLGLGLRQLGIDATIYSERTPEQLLTRQLSNMVARNAQTRQRERQLGVNHWDSPRHDIERMAVAIRGTPISFAGRYGSPPQAVDMRIYAARLLEDFSARGGRVVIRTVESGELEGLAAQHELLVVASGRTSLSTIFPRVAEHSPHTVPQRLCIGGYFRGIAYSEPRALEIIVTPGSGEILVLAAQSFEPDVTGIGILITTGGLFEPLRHVRYKDDPRAFNAAVLELLRQHAPTVFERVDTASFDASRPLDVAYAAITPVVRRGFVEFGNGRLAMALGDAHVLIDPITGQGANSASHGAAVLCEAIRAAKVFDRTFCERTEAQICAYAVPVSDAANARLQPPAPPFRQLLAAASHDQTIADFYAYGFNHPDEFWAIASSAERTASFLGEVEQRKASVGS